MCPDMVSRLQKKKSPMDHIFYIHINVTLLLILQPPVTQMNIIQDMQTRYTMLMWYFRLVCLGVTKTLLPIEDVNYFMFRLFCLGFPTNRAKMVFRVVHLHWVGSAAVTVTGIVEFCAIRIHKLRENL